MGCAASTSTMKAKVADREESVFDTRKLLSELITIQTALVMSDIGTGQVKQHAFSTSMHTRLGFSDEKSVNFTKTLVKERGNKISSDSTVSPQNGTDSV